MRLSGGAFILRIIFTQPTVDHQACNADTHTHTHRGSKHTVLSGGIRSYDTTMAAVLIHSYKQALCRQTARKPIKADERRSFRFTPVVHLSSPASVEPVRRDRSGERGACILALRCQHIGLGLVAMDCVQGGSCAEEETGLAKAHRHFLLCLKTNKMLDSSFTGSK